jgi:hypothetical protein
MTYHHTTTSTSTRAHPPNPLKSLILNKIPILFFCLLTLGISHVKASVAEQFGLRVGDGDISRKLDLRQNIQLQN